MVATSLESAIGHEGCLGCNKSADGGAWCGSACSSPNGYTLSPGCCANTRPCCDNAWAGYCDHRAKVQAFWAKVGTPRPANTCIFTPVMPAGCMKVVQVPACEQPVPVESAANDRPHSHACPPRQPHQQPRCLRSRKRHRRRRQLKRRRNRLTTAFHREKAPHRRGFWLAENEISSAMPTLVVGIFNWRIQHVHASVDMASPISSR